MRHDTTGYNIASHRMISYHQTARLTPSLHTKQCPPKTVPMDWVAKKRSQGSTLRMFTGWVPQKYFLGLGTGRTGISYDWTHAVHWTQCRKPVYYIYIYIYICNPTLPRSPESVASLDKRWQRDTRTVVHRFGISYGLVYDIRWDCIGEELR